MTTGPEFKVGDTISTEIGGFEVLDLLGEGGMGAVYKVVPADASRGRREKALKTVHPELLHRAEMIERFEAEGRVLSEFDHENIIQIDGIYKMRSNPPRPFILMELLQGFTLRFIMERSDTPLTVQDACVTAVGLCYALEEIHRRNMIHRDIKPENIYIQKRRKGQTRVVLIDFGIMKQILKEDGSAHTSKVFLGSLSHASPEQLLGQPISPKSDIYSLAVVLYEMLSGAPIFPDLKEARSIGQAHIDRVPVPLGLIAPHVPVEISDAIMKALEKNPALRPSVHGLRAPFTNVRTAIIRGQAVGAGNSTIERILSNTMGGDVPPPTPATTGTAQLPTLNATTVPAAMFAGTQEALPPLTDRGRLATTPVQSVEPPAPSGGARTTDPASLAPRSATHESLVLPVHKTRIPLLVALGGVIAVAGVMGSALLVRYSARSTEVPAAVAPAAPTSLPAPLPIASALPRAPRPVEEPAAAPAPAPPEAAQTLHFVSPAPSATASASSDTTPVSRSRSPSKPASHSAKPSGNKVPRDEDLFEVVKPKPAASSVLPF